MSVKPAGSTWKIVHQRKGNLTIRLTHDVTPDTEWVQCDLVDGKPKFNSEEYRGKVFESLTIRQSLLKWVSEVTP